MKETNGKSAKAAAMFMALSMAFTALAANVSSKAANPFAPSDRLLAAIRTHETLDGELSGNTLQILPIYVRDVNRIHGTSFRLADVHDRHKSEVMARLYLSYWGRRYHKRTGRLPTDEVFARMHNGGGRDGWRKAATRRYWLKVKAILDADAP